MRSRPMAAELGHSQAGQQGRGGRQGVEGGQVFAVGNQTLEDAPGQVMGVGGTGGGDAFGGVSQGVQEGGGGGRWQLGHDIAGNRKDGPVVDVQDGGPGGQDFILGGW